MSQSNKNRQPVLSRDLAELQRLVKSDLWAVYMEMCKQARRTADIQLHEAARSGSDKVIYWEGVYEGVAWIAQIMAQKLKDSQFKVAASNKPSDRPSRGLSKYLSREGGIHSGR